MNKPFSRVAAVKAAALMATSTYVTVALGLVVSAVIARSLGPDDYGRYAYLLWLSGLLVVLGVNGFGISAIRFISESIGKGLPDTASNIHGWLRRRQLLSAIGMAVVFALVFPWVKPAGWEGQTGLLVAVVIVSVMAKTMYLFDVSVAKGHGLFSVEAWSTMVMSLIYTSGVVMLALLHATLSAYLIFFAMVSVGHMVVIRPMMKRLDVKPGRGPCDEELLSRVKSHWAWTVVQVSVATLSNKTIETFLLNSLIGPAEVGYFAIATNLTRGAVELVSSSLTTLLMPAMAHAYGAGGMKQVNAILSDALRYSMFLGLMIAGLGTLWAALGVGLMYGAKYAPVVHVLQAMVLIGGLTLTEGAFGAVLSTTDNQRVRAYVALLSVGISAAAALILVPRYGLMGAVMAHAITRLTLLSVMTLFITNLLKLSLPWRELARLGASAGLAALLAGGLVWLHPHVLVEFAAGIVYAVVFIIATVWFKGWRAKDARLLASLAGRKPALTGRWVPTLERWASRLPE
ncbi:oligosaccharide flippase family protein [Aquabacterium sp.]|uniref:oligosaccharide flippase family protein n=1 Tax=Aquabacterium sp. TaxID=1872578 RepID=UPI003D6CB083